MQCIYLAEFIVMAERGSDCSFFRVGEIRPANDSDFNYFRTLINDFSGWRKNHEKNGVTVYSKEMGKASIKMVKVHAEFKDVLPGTFYDVIHDGKYRRTWDENMIDDDDICALDDNNDIGYYSMDCPAPLKNRDLVNQRSWRVTEDEYIVFNHSVAHEKYPPRKNFIRAVSYVTGFLIKSNRNGGCDVTYISHSDLRGQVPKWTMNLGVTKLVPKVLKKIEEAAKMYPQWKENNDPAFKPWIFPEQSKLPRVDARTLSLSQTSMPLGPAGEEDGTDTIESVEGPMDGHREA